MTLINKIKWILGISLIFSLIATTNLLDRHNFIQLNQSVTSIYEDRLMAKNVLSDIHATMMEKKMAFAIQDEKYFKGGYAALDQELLELVERFEDGATTANEKRILLKLKDNIASLHHHRALRKRDVSVGNEQAIDLIGEIENHLNDLSDIQLIEGRRQLVLSQRATDAIELFTQMEIVILIILAIMVQVIILYKPKSAYQ